MAILATCHTVLVLLVSVTVLPCAHSQTDEDTANMTTVPQEATPGDSSFACVHGRFGPKCSSICNCVDNCNQQTGACKKCLPGYLNPDLGCVTASVKTIISRCVDSDCTACVAGYRNTNRSCTEECPVMTFGVNCSGDCMKVCKEDCVERVYGKCWDSRIDVLLDAPENMKNLLFFLLPPPLCLLIIYRLFG
ncbi:multiple epidermal growth factor-like domains protein 10, partial [Physella acuta]|uniref:multiple epidermal growth factor-like domains protein 10 n=1 Tax=Physella acuta TaxID=109671 RepID=UPI0027DE28F1